MADKEKTNSKVSKAKSDKTKKEKVKEEVKKVEKKSASNKKTTNVSAKARNTKNGSTVKKQSKKNDDRIKQIIAEQLASINQIEKTTGPLPKSNARKKTKVNDKSETNEVKKDNKENKDNKAKKPKEEIKEIVKKSKNNIVASKNEDIEKNVKKVENVEKKKSKFDPKIVEENIESKKKLPKEEKEKIHRKMLLSLFIGLLIALYMLFLELGFLNIVKIPKENFKLYLNIFSGVYLIIAIILFEISYKKESGTVALFGIEFLGMGIITLGLTYIFAAKQARFVKFVEIIRLLVIFYYFVKSIIIRIRGKIKYNQTLSDVREIIEE